MFETIGWRFGQLWSWLRADEKRSFSTALHRVYSALHEAGVTLPVILELLERFERRARARTSLDGHAFASFLHAELAGLMDDEERAPRFAVDGPTVVLVTGREGGLKTGACGRLARHFESQGRKPALVAAGKRTWEVERLEHLARMAGLPFLTQRGETPARICQGALEEIDGSDIDMLVVDTGGCDPFDRATLEPIREAQGAVTAHELLFVCEARDAAAALLDARAAEEGLGLTGLILDGLADDDRGGAIISLAAAGAKPLKFIGANGWDPEELLVEFEPDSMARRILSLGVPLDAGQQHETTYGLDEFLHELRKLKKTTAFKQFLVLVPGIGDHPETLSFDTQELSHMEGMILSMTPAERVDPELIDPSRRDRIARGCGAAPYDVDIFLQKFILLREGIRTLREK